MGRRKNDRRARNTGGLRQKGNAFEGRLRVRKKDGSYIEKSFSRNTKSECQQVINLLRGYEPLDNDVEQIKIDRHTNNIKLIRKGQKNNIDSNMLFSEYMDYFIWNHRRKGIKKAVIKDTTLDSYIDGARIIKSILGDRKIADISFEDVKEALETIHATKSDSTAKKVKNLVYSAFKYAKKDNVIASNILEDEEIHFRERKGRAEKKIIEKEDIRTFINYCLENKEYMILFILFTGVRESEACGIKWKNIDMDHRIVHIEQAHMRVKKYKYEDGKILKNGSKRETTDLKSKSSYRVIGLPEEYIKILEEHKKAQIELAEKCYKSFSEEDFVFTTQKYKAYVADGVNDRFTNIMNNIKIKHYEELTIHSLRHSYCSIGIRNGVTLKEMQKILGHSSIAVTANIYSHLDTETVIEASNKVSGNMSIYINEYKNNQNSEEKCG